MQVSLFVDFGLRVMMYLDQHSDRRATVAEIAESYKISRNHLVKVVHRLATKGLIKSFKGKGGGITLAQPARKVTIGQVVRAMKDNLEPVSRKKARGPLSPGRELRGAFDEATAAYLKALDRYTIADVSRAKKGKLRLVG